MLHASYKSLWYRQYVKQFEMKVTVVILIIFCVVIIIFN